MSCQVGQSIENIFTQHIYQNWSHYLFELLVLISRQLGDKFVILTIKHVNALYDTYLMLLFVFKWIVAWLVAATPTILLIMAVTWCGLRHFQCRWEMARERNNKMHSVTGCDFNKSLTTLHWVVLASLLVIKYIYWISFTVVFDQIRYRKSNKI